MIEFLKLYWLIAQAEARPGENVLVCFGSDGDGGGGGDGGGEITDGGAG